MGRLLGRLSGSHQPGSERSASASEFVNLSAGYRISNNLRIHGTATNLLDQERFQLYGGSVIGRRVLAGLTAKF
ncbi:MAG: TonB-dependent receptor [Gemmatimonadota bacterium]|nr:TonB-dependent receptor [Gemmatimonadota bacterium]